MKLAAVSLVSSSLMASLRSCANQWSRCLTSFAPSLMLRECSITSRGTPGMSEGFQPKMSWFCRRKVTSALSYLESSSIPIRAVLVGSDELSMIFLNSWLELILDLAAFLAGAFLAAFFGAAFFAAFLGADFLAAFLGAGFAGAFLFE